ncbi:MAG: hypothetical protein ACI923_002061 [Flavobacteriales bacterium]|jgi:hypothetical protein
MKDERLSVYALFEENRDARLVFTYRGPFQDSLTERIIGISENTLENQGEMARANRKVSFLIVECFQNMLKHGESMINLDGSLGDRGLFGFHSFDSTFYINSINPISLAEKARIRRLVDHVNTLSREELKELYKEQIQTNCLSDKGGAGLGLIELARKSGQPIRYRFDDINEKQSLFSNQVLFKKDINEEEKNFVSKTRGSYDQMLKDGNLMFYKGDLSQKSILPLLNIVELNVSLSPQQRTMKKVGHILIEMLQNISRHTPEVDKRREGVFLIGISPFGIRIQSGNVISNSVIPILKERLDEITGKSPEELKNLHRLKFKESIHMKDKNSSGLGLIQVAKACNGRFIYNFKDLGKGESFFSFGVVV